MPRLATTTFRTVRTPTSYYTHNQRQTHTLSQLSFPQAPHYSVYTHSGTTNRSNVVHRNIRNQQPRKMSSAGVPSNQQQQVSQVVATNLRSRRFAPLNPEKSGGNVGDVPVSTLKGVVFDVDGTLCLPQHHMFQEMRYVSLPMLTTNSPYIKHRTHKTSTILTCTPPQICLRNR